MSEYYKRVIIWVNFSQMEITPKTIIFAVVSVILIAAILGGVFYLLKNSKQLSFSNNNKETPLSKLQVVGSGPTPQTLGENITPSPTLPAGNTKTYQGQNFALRYPGNWGIVTCNNSLNIEFDPYSSSDLKNYACDRAIKPITIVVSKGPLNCPGENLKIGNSNVVKSKTDTANWVKNRWCVSKGGVNLDITNRVAPTGITGTGKDDFSKQIEQIISSL